MAYYLVQAAYSSEGSATLVKHPQNRLDAVRPVVEKLGGSIEGFWFAFGDYDAVAICRMPDNVSAAAFAMAASAGGGVKTLKTTPLLTMDESVEALKKAAEAGYQPPVS